MCLVAMLQNHLIVCKHIINMKYNNYSKQYLKPFNCVQTNELLHI